MPLTVKLIVNGQIDSSREKITCDLEVPDDWKPHWHEFSKVLGAVRFLTEKLEQHFTPPPTNN